MTDRQSTLKAAKRAKDAAEMRRTLNILLTRHGGEFQGGTLHMDEAAFWQFVDDAMGIAKGAQLI